MQRTSSERYSLVVVPRSALLAAPDISVTLDSPVVIATPSRHHSFARDDLQGPPGDTAAGCERNGKSGSVTKKLVVRHGDDNACWPNYCKAA